MKISVYYEDRNHPIVLDVPDEQCEIWVEEDYRRRLSEAEDRGTVTRRTAQEIMDEDYNRPTFNNQQKETRRHVPLDALDAEREDLGFAPNPEDLVIQREGNREMQAGIDKLNSSQKKLVRKVYWEDRKQADIAKSEGVSPSAISQRLNTICARLKKNLTEKP